MESGAAYWASPNGCVPMTQQAPSHKELASQALSAHAGRRFEVVMEFDRQHDDGTPLVMRVCDLGVVTSAQLLRLVMRHMLVNASKNPWMGLFFAQAVSQYLLKICVCAADMGPWYPGALSLWYDFRDRFEIKEKCGVEPVRRNHSFFIPMQRNDSDALLRANYMTARCVSLRAICHDDPDDPQNCAVIYSLPFMQSCF